MQASACFSVEACLGVTLDLRLSEIGLGFRVLAIDMLHQKNEPPGQGNASGPVPWDGGWVDGGLA